MKGYKAHVQRHLRPALFFANLFLGAVTASAAPQILINIDFPGALATYTEAINASGQVVGWYLVSGSDYHAVRWDQGVFTSIDPPGAVRAQPRDINDSGQVVGFYIDSGGKEHGFLWDNGTFTTIDPPGARSTSLAAINATGQIVGNYDGHGFLWDQGTFTTIDVPGFGVLDTGVSDINAAGQIIGGYGMDPDFAGAFVWENGTFSFIGPGDRSTVAAAINDSGQIVGSYDSYDPEPTPIQAFLIPNGNNPIDPPDAVPTPTFPGFAAFMASASDINAAGSVVGYYNDSTQTLHGFLLQDGTYTRIDPPSSVSSTTVGINLAGEIVGSYANSSGSHGFLARPASVVNGLVHLNSVKTSFDATPVPGGPAGTFTIRSNFTNTSSTTINTPQFVVTQLSNGNLLLNADVAPGGADARLTPVVGSDEVLSPGESFDAAFVIGLQKRKAFTFFVDLLGVNEP